MICYAGSSSFHETALISVSVAIRLVYQAKLGLDEYCTYRDEDDQNQTYDILDTAHAHITHHSCDELHLYLSYLSEGDVAHLSEYPRQ